MGRPTKFTDETCSIILEKIEQGNYCSIASRYAGVSYKNFKVWMQRGLSDAPGNAGFRAFRAAVKRAKAKAEADALERIRVAATSGTWQADAWYLERAHRERWAGATKLQVAGKKGAPLEFTSPGLDQAAKELREWRERMTPAPSSSPSRAPT